MNNTRKNHSNRAIINMVAKKIKEYYSNHYIERGRTNNTFISHNNTNRDFKAKMEFNQYIDNIVINAQSNIGQITSNRGFFTRLTNTAGITVRKSGSHESDKIKIRNKTIKSMLDYAQGKMPMDKGIGYDDLIKDLKNDEYSNYVEEALSNSTNSVGGSRKYKKRANKRTRRCR
jgi:hypothetical protein